MDISRVSSNKQLTSTTSITTKKASQEFGSELSSASKRERDRYLNKLMDSIKKKGRQIIESGSIKAVHEYKNYIKEYLSVVLKDAYKVERLRSLYDGNPSVFVDIVNKELDELAQTVLVEEKGTIKVVNKIDNIEGLLLDVYK
jgi:Uncharacterized protein conserved in bacteria